MHIKDILILVTAAIAAIVSIISIIINIYYSKKKERSNRLWEKELERFFDLEENVGILVEHLMSFRYRSEAKHEDYYRQQQYLALAVGRFRRYSTVSQALRNLQNDAGWYFCQDMKHETKEDYNEARENLEKSYKEFICACDAVMER